MRIVVNTRSWMSGKMEGIGHFTAETITRMAHDHPEHEFHLLFDRAFNPDFISQANMVGHVLPPPVRLPFLYKLWYDWLVPRFLNKIGADLFLSPDGHASLRTTVPQVTVIHDVFFVHYPADVPFRFRSFLLRRTPQYIEKSVAVVTVSAFSKNDLISQYGVSPEKVHVVYNGYNGAYRPLTETEQKEVREKMTQGKPYFIAISAIHPRKNLQRLIPAFEKFKEKTGLPHQLLIVGRPFWKNESMRQLRTNLKYEKDIIFTGRLEFSELSQALGAAHANVYISYFEGFGVPIIEAFACGVPVLTANTSSTPEVAGDAALVVDPFSIEDIANALERLAVDEQLCEELKRKGFERVKDFNWDLSAKELWKVVESHLPKQ